VPSRPPLGPGCDNSTRTDSRGQALANGSAVVFDGASDPAAPLAWGCHRLSRRHTDPARSAPGQRYHTHDRIEPAQRGRIYRVDIELWPTSPRSRLPTGAPVPGQAHGAFLTAMRIRP